MYINFKNSLLNIFFDFWLTILFSLFSFFCYACLDLRKIHLENMLSDSIERCLLILFCKITFFVSSMVYFYVF